MLTIPAIICRLFLTRWVSTSNSMPMRSAAIACSRSSLTRSVTSSIARRTLCILLRDRRTLRALSTITRRPIDEASMVFPLEMIVSSAVRSSGMSTLRCRAHRASGRPHPPGATANVSQKERFAKRMTKSESSTRRPSRTVSTTSEASTSRTATAPAHLPIAVPVLDSCKANLSLASELVGQHVSVIWANDIPSAFTAKAATKTILIVFVSGADPVRVGLVENLKSTER
jgi:hypothetical protein